MMEVCLLGCGGMVPLPDRHLSSMLIRGHGKIILVDCGEGTQVSIKKTGWGFKSIDAVCLTHYHADHVAGLPGFLLTLGNSGRTEPLSIFGPPPLAYVLSALTVIAPELPYEIRLEELSSEKESSIEHGGFLIGSLPMVHAIPCLAYRFEMKRTGKFQKERAEAQKIPKEYWNSLQKGNEIEYGGRKISPAMVMGPPRKGLKITYCTDSRPTDELIQFSCESDLLVCEGMYGENDMLEKAIARQHMLFSEAAEIAARGKSKELWLTHFSPSLKEPEMFLYFSRNIFPNTTVGKDLLATTLNFINC